MEYFFFHVDKSYKYSKININIVTLDCAKKEPGIFPFKMYRWMQLALYARKKKNRVEKGNSS